MMHSTKRFGSVICIAVASSIARLNANTPPYALRGSPSNAMSSKIPTNGLIIRGRPGKGRRRQALACCQGELALIGRELGQHSLVLIGTGHDRDIPVVLGGRAHHGGPANVDILNDLLV